LPPPNLLRLSERRRCRAAWSDPGRKLLTLESFARTEEDGGRDIASAARAVRDPELRAHLERHAADEARHAGLFRDRARALRAEGVSAPSTPAAPGPDLHGAHAGGLFADLGEVGYVAFLHVAERRARDLFELHRELVGADAATRALFEDILRDEKYHVAYTGTILERWRRQGRGGEVRAALAQARGSRWLEGWKRFGARAGARLSRAILRVLYFTLLAPAAIPARKLARERGGWRPPPAGRDPRSQG